MPSLKSRSRKRKRKRAARTTTRARTRPNPPRRKRKAPRSPRPPRKESGGESKGVLVEETPTLDTYQARQAVRIITGAVLFGILCLISFVIYRVFAPSGTLEPSAVDEGTITANAPVNPQNSEQEARTMFERAHEVARNGNTQARDLTAPEGGQVVSQVPDGGRGAPAL